MTEIKLDKATNEEIEIFKRIVPGTNFFTRNKLEYFSTNRYIIELSKSTLDEFGNLYGITIIEKLSNNEYIRRDDISTAKHSFEEVIEYLNNLKDETVCQDSKGNS